MSIRSRSSHDDTNNVEPNTDPYSEPNSARPGTEARDITAGSIPVASGRFDTAAAEAAVGRDGAISTGVTASAMTPGPRFQVLELLAQHGKLAGQYMCLGGDPWEFHLRYGSVDSNGQGDRSYGSDRSGQGGQGDRSYGSDRSGQGGQGDRSYGSDRADRNGVAGGGDYREPASSEDGTRVPIGFTPFLRTKHAVMVWRAPVGPVGSELEALRSFDREVDPKSDRFILGADQATADAAALLGYQKMWIGTDCVTSLKDWSLAGGHRRKIRWARNHAAKTHEWLEVFPVADASARSQMLEVEAEWKAARKTRATDSFLRTALMEQSDIRRYFVSRELATGRIDSYVACLPENSDRWYLQDCVRHSQAARGTLEGAVALACETFSNEGFGSVSNGILPMHDPGDGTHIPETSPLRRFAIRVADRKYRFGGLNQFRMKLTPDETTPVYVLLKPGRPSVRGLAGFIRIATKRL